jgi:hypothetical protein
VVDSCYICRRTRVDLEHLNEEIRTRVYLSYFSNARSQIDEQRRRISFLQRLKDEESGDPHFRINAMQVFADPAAYKKLMPWIDTLMEVVASESKKVDESASIGMLLDELLTSERRTISKMEDGLNQIRGGFALGGSSPLSLDTVTYSFPVKWTTDTFPFPWHAGQPNEVEPLQRSETGARATVQVELHLCSVCRRMLSETTTTGTSDFRASVETGRRGNGLA